MEGCIACDLAEGRMTLPGGRIHETAHWLVEHCVGPLGVGTLIVKPRRHVVHVARLDPDEAGELGPVLGGACAAVEALVHPDQVYVTLWSHAGATPQHVHWVVQPVTKAVIAAHGGLYGPALQAAMFEHDEPPAATEVEAAAERLRRWFGGSRPAGHDPH
jgi:ATP adenylyltransferase